MKPQVTILTNGITVVSQKSAEARTFNIGIWGRFGARHENPEQNGIAHFFEHMTFKGTSKRSEIEISEQIADTGGISDAATDRDMTMFSLEVMDSDREFAIELLSDMLMNSTFTNKNIDSEREVIFQEMYEDENDDEDTFGDAFAKLVYGEQSLGSDILGTKECLENIGREELLAWRKRFCCGENIIISAIGNFAHEELVQLVEKYFGSLEKGCKNIAQAQKYIGGFKHIKPTDSQTKLEIGFDLLSQDTSLKNEAKYLLMQILGSDDTSRLFIEARVKRSLVYEIGSLITDWQDTGIFGTIVCAQAQNVNKVLDIVIQEIKKLKTELVSEKELERAKRRQIFRIIKRAKSFDESYEETAEQVLFFGEPKELDEMIARINAVTAEDIRQTAQAIFSTRPTYLVQGKIKSYYSYQKLCNLLK